MHELVSICRPDTPSDPEKRELREQLNQQKAECLERIKEDGLSKKQLKKRLKNPSKNFDPNKKQKFDTCSACANPRVSIKKMNERYFEDINSREMLRQIWLKWLFLP